MRSTPSLRSCTNVALKNSSNVGLIDGGPFLVLSRNIVLSAYASLLQGIDGVMSLALCPKVVHYNGNNFANCSRAEPKPLEMESFILNQTIAVWPSVSVM